MKKHRYFLFLALIVFVFAPKVSSTTMLWLPDNQLIGCNCAGDSKCRAILGYEAAVARDVQCLAELEAKDDERMKNDPVHKERAQVVEKMFQDCLSSDQCSVFESGDSRFSIRVDKSSDFIKVMHTFKDEFVQAMVLWQGKDGVTAGTLFEMDYKPNTSETSVWLTKCILPSRAKERFDEFTDIYKVTLLGQPTGSHADIIEEKLHKMMQPALTNTYYLCP